MNIQFSINFFSYYQYYSTFIIKQSDSNKTRVMGSNMYVRTIDLNKKFNEIEKQLYEIALLVNDTL